MSAIRTYLTRPFSYVFEMIHSRWDRVMSASLLVFVCALIMPATPTARSASTPASQWVSWVEDRGRFLNTGLQIAMPLITRDVVAIKSLLVISVLGTSSTHGLKHSLNSFEVGSVRLGERPSSTTSKHNFPSGHSSLASSGAVFVGRRYGWHWLWILVPMTLATMVARVELGAHTWTATVAGAALGVLFTWPFCRPRQPSRHVDASC